MTRPDALLSALRNRSWWAEPLAEFYTLPELAILAREMDYAYAEQEAPADARFIERIDWRGDTCMLIHLRYPTIQAGKS
jgi:hypothetical protein